MGPDCPAKNIYSWDGFEFLFINYWWTLLEMAFLTYLATSVTACVYVLTFH